MCGVVMALLWMLEHAYTCSVYARNHLEGFRRVDANKDLIEYMQEVLSHVREKRKVMFIHAKGHSADGGNDRADLLIQ